MSQILGEGTRVPVVAPRGLDEIVATFGDIFEYIHPDHSLDPRWQTDFLERTALPFPMVLSWGPYAHCTPDHLSQGSVRNLRRCVLTNSARRLAKQNHRLRRLLLVPPATHWHETFSTRLGNCN
jgi:hypothetical protein